MTYNVQYSTDNGSTWTNVALGENQDLVIPVHEGDTILFKSSDYRAINDGGTTNYLKFSGGYSQAEKASFEVEGNIMSLIYGDNFTGQTTLPTAYTFFYLFSNSDVILAENLILPATTLAVGCYEGMFNGCTSLSTAPELPATTLAGRCYDSMFNGCTSLSTAPELPATTLAQSCYSYMFSWCTSLTSAPELPATTLVSNCYSNMFYGCTNLNYIKCLATNVSASNCTFSWVYGVSSTGTFVTPQSTSWTTGTRGIPTNWTRVDAS